MLGRSTDQCRRLRSRTRPLCQGSSAPILPRDPREHHPSHKLSRPHGIIRNPAHSLSASRCDVRATRLTVERDALSGRGVSQWCGWREHRRLLDDGLGLESFDKLAVLVEQFNDDAPTHVVAAMSSRDKDQTPQSRPDPSRHLPEAQDRREAEDRLDEDRSLQHRSHT